MTDTGHNLINTEQKSQGRNTFLLALGLAFLIFIPFIIKDRGYFVMYGDFNVQQIPFYQLAHRAIRSGEMGWNWYTDLGANFVASYSFYLLYSPFFWLTIPFPTSAVPYLIAPLLMLKTACAAFTAYLYLERFVKNKRSALVGGILYAFSGWMFFNIFFNHFHEVAVFFPLLLLGVEKLITEDKKLFFALMVAVNAIVNYWFFFGEVVFVIIYVIIRTYGKGWKLTVKKFLLLGFEAVVGVLLSAVALLPSVLGVVGNPRTGSDNLLYGWGAWIYWYNTEKYGGYSQRIYAILQSFIFPPELTARPNFFSAHGAQWASLSAWLPMFSLAGVIGYFTIKKNRPDWLKKMIALMLVMTLIPGLNSLFVGLNNAYYARWYYMGILLLSLATVLLLDSQPQVVRLGLKAGVKWTGIAALIFVIACGLTPDYRDGKWVIGLAKDPALMWVWTVVLLFGLGVLVLMIYNIDKKVLFNKILLAGLSISIVGFGVIYIASGQTVYPRSDNVIKRGLGKNISHSMPKDPFARSDVYDDMDNLLMYWQLPTIQAFHSVVPPSIMEFYEYIGIKRSEASRPGPEDTALRSLLSVRWLFVDEEKEEQEPIVGFELWDTIEGYNIYENRGFIPMGFTYENVVSKRELETVAKNQRTQIMLRAVALEKKDIESYKHLLTPLPKKELVDFSYGSMVKSYETRRESALDSFKRDKKGFTAQSGFDQPELVFFSVPYELGWRAFVDGSPVEIVRANIGFMAIEVPEGEREIRFEYTTPGLIAGGIISLIGAGILLVYWLILRGSKAVPAVEQGIPEAETENNGESLSWEKKTEVTASEEPDEQYTDPDEKRIMEMVAKHLNKGGK